MEFSSEPTLLWESASVLAVGKPPGWFVHPSPLDPKAPSILDWLRARLESDVWVVHRIDRPTRGIVLFAKTREAASLLAAQFRERTIEKSYLCVTRGWLPDSGVIDRPLQRMDEDPGEESAAQEACTRYTSLTRVEFPWEHGAHPTSRYSLVQADPETGRFHQIRRHLAGFSHPLIGDTRYGEGWHNRKFREIFGFHELALFARKISFQDPGTEVRVELKAPLAPSWVRLLEGFDQDSNSTRVAPAPPNP
jgi:tRNA pseudouridine65 synthase